VTLIDSAEETAATVGQLLREQGLAAGGGAVTHRFAVSDDPTRFTAVGSRFLGERLSDVEVVSVEQAG
jgi:glutamate racemase